MIWCLFIEPSRIGNDSGYNDIGAYVYTVVLALPLLSYISTRAMALRRLSDEKTTPLARRVA